MAKDFEKLVKAASKKYESQSALQASLPKSLTAAQLRKVSDDRYLAEMTKCVFRAGFVWRVIEHKWPGFEEVFHGFDPAWLRRQSPEAIESIAQDTRIVRNYTKVKATQDNAQFVYDTAELAGSFGNFLAEWPQDDVVGLWLHLKKHGSRLGGMSAQYFLRFVGKDTFIITDDVVKGLRQHGYLNEGYLNKADVGMTFPPTEKFSSQKSQRALQEIFKQLTQETGYTYSQISRLLALSV